MSTNEKSPEIRLDEDQVKWAASVGRRRHSESEKRKKRQSDGSRDANALPNHIRGAIAELALSNFLNEPWQATVNAYNDFPDLNGYLECRGKKSGQPFLRIYKKDEKAQKGHSIFVSVTRLKDDGNARTNFEDDEWVVRHLADFRIDGWIVGKDAMKSEFWTYNEQYKRSEWQVPVSVLQPPSTLGKELDVRLRLLEKGRQKLRDWMAAGLEARALKAEQKGR